MTSRQFPRTSTELSKFDVIVLSDIGANSFQLPPETWLGANRALIVYPYWPNGFTTVDR